MILLDGLLVWEFVMFDSFWVLVKCLEMLIESSKFEYDQWFRGCFDVDFVNDYVMINNQKSKLRELSLLFYLNFT